MVRSFCYVKENLPGGKIDEAGKSNMAIGKELGLGIGEVKLVIDLFEGL